MNSWTLEIVARGTAEVAHPGALSKGATKRAASRPMCASELATVRESFRAARRLPVNGHSIAASSGRCRAAASAAKLSGPSRHTGLLHLRNNRRHLTPNSRDSAHPRVAGATVLRHPFHAEEIGAKLDSYVRLKLDSDRARRDTSVADATGFYTVRGLALRAQELTLQAFHHAEPLACVAIAPVTADGQNADALDLLADVLRATGRRSDAIGRVGPGEFAVIAPGTDRTGAVLLAERLARGVTAAARQDGGTPAPGLRAGYDAVGNARYTPIEPKNLLSRATTALRAAKGQGGPNWIEGFRG